MFCLPKTAWPPTYRQLALDALLFNCGKMPGEPKNPGIKKSASKRFYSEKWYPTTSATGVSRVSR